MSQRIDIQKSAIRVENLSKRFKIPHERKSTLFENLVGVFKRRQYETFYALRDIHIDIKRGEFVGLIGENGSGKSTLLRTIAKILVPTKGNVYSTGKLVSFIELGVGFQIELTAKENIFLYGAVMGMSRKEILSKYDKIVEFAGVKRFMDTKLKNFSSGMTVRLAFSTAIQTDCDILLLDEVLAVGDTDFQKKCYKVFEDLKRKGTTIIFASHNLEVIEKYCNRTVYLKNGHLIYCGTSKNAIAKYAGEIE